jgi:hypothetical protein
MSTIVLSSQMMRAGYPSKSDDDEMEDIELSVHDYKRHLQQFEVDSDSEASAESYIL